MRSDIHGVILLLGRPASGKSEIIDYLTRMDPEERRRRMHVGTPVILDDFPMLWAWFEEDDILQAMGRPRLHSTADGWFLGQHLWDVLIRRLCLEHEKLLAADPRLHDHTTVVIEFSRGTEHGGYQAAFGELSAAVRERAAALYVEVSYEESLRKNRRRFNPAKPYSILEHGLSDEKLTTLYKDDDFNAVSGRGLPFPSVVFPNNDDVTTPRGAALGQRLEEKLTELWKKH